MLLNAAVAAGLTPSEFYSIPSRIPDSGPLIAATSRLLDEFRPLTSQIGVNPAATALLVRLVQAEVSLLENNLTTTSVLDWWPGMAEAESSLRAAIESLERRCPI